jgi:hypothetical protein
MSCDGEIWGITKEYYLEEFHIVIPRVHWTGQVGWEYTCKGFEVFFKIYICGWWGTSVEIWWAYIDWQQEHRIYKSNGLIQMIRAETQDSLIQEKGH